ncbi:cellulose binding domain-containing protein [Hamadaea tsunoensis]|uniref:cellulose binding domain-containing protein n=1 Tax=Hamadaea tsunoensis TaxID=53368 RepID=UPI00040536EC|nr:cellulose binding domain-containing protein [Hamadaea tsunoensis]
MRLHRPALAALATAAALLMQAPAYAADSTPPSAPSAPNFSSVTTTALNAAWGESADDTGVAGYYLQQLVGGVWTTIRTTTPSGRFQSVTGLSPATSYSFAVVAFDAAGNASARSATGTVTTLALTPYVTCRVQVVTFSTGFIATVTLVNTTVAATTGWRVGFSLPAAITVGSVFNAALTRSGTAGTLAPLAYSAVIAPGGQLPVGFAGSGPAPVTPPSAFSLDGRPCTAG